MASSFFILELHGTALVTPIDFAAMFLCIVCDGSCSVVFFSLFLCPGLLPPQVLGQSSGRATIPGFLQIICEEISWATHFISGEIVV